MALGQSEIEREVLQPSKRPEIQKAIAHQDWIKLHADTNLDVINSVPFRKFVLFVRSQLPEDKFLTTMNNLKFPLPTNSITKSIFVKLSKLFDGRNPAFNYQFHNTGERDDWEWYRQEVLDEPNLWSQKAWRFFQTEINSVLVVDMPANPDPTDKYPQPYSYFVPIGDVISYAVNDRNKCMDWIIYRNGGRIIVIDDFSYRTFASEDGRLGMMLSDNAHGLGYCPAKFLWNEPLSLGCPDVKESPLSKKLSDLDWYLFKSLGVKHLDTYASYPIYSAYEEECDYVDKDGDVCHKGHLQKPDGTYLTDSMGNLVPCPLCHGKKQLAGAGSFISVPIPAEGQPDLRNPVDITTIDRKSLDYNIGELERLEVNIINGCVGVDNTILNETSLADKQVDATFESKDSVLNRIKKGFEEIQEWHDATCCRLRYGSAFISANVNYGNEFYTLTPEVLQARYANAKQNGASEAELDAIRQQLIETQYRHNPTMLQRMIILDDLEPLRHKTFDQVQRMRADGLVPDEVAVLKTDFMSFIDRFERENDNILEFGTSIPYSEKIKNIYNTLLSYAKQRTVPSLT